MDFLDDAPISSRTPTNLTMGQNSTGIGLSSAEIWIQIIFFYGFLAGIVTTTCGTMIVIGIIRQKKLRNRFFAIVGFLIFCRILKCIQYLVMAVHRSLRQVDIVPLHEPRIVCHTIHFLSIICHSVEVCLVFMLVVDRVMAIMASTYYRQLTTRSAISACFIVSVSVSFVKILPSYFGRDLLDVVECLNVYSAPHYAYNIFSQSFDFIVTGVILILYSILLIYVRRKARKINCKEENGSGHKDSKKSIILQRHLKLMPLLRNLVLMHCFLSLTSKLLFFLASLVPRSIEPRMTAYGGMCACVDVFANVIVLLITNEDIRKASLPKWALCGTEVVEIDAQDTGMHSKSDGRRQSQSQASSRRPSTRSAAP